MIGGLFCAGSLHLVVRATGPLTRCLGVAGPWPIPCWNCMIPRTLFRQMIIGGRTKKEIRETGLAPENDLESAFVRILAPGTYTAIVRGQATPRALAWSKFTISSEQSSATLLTGYNSICS